MFRAVPKPQPKPVPDRVKVDRHIIEGVLDEFEHQRDQLRSILDLMDTGRTQQARDAIRHLLARLS